MSEITQPLRLAVGSHAAGSGKGCAMNVISWENGDSKITDFPSCSDRLLARIVQRVNDTICTHRNSNLLCPDCSVKVLELGHRTVGTGDINLAYLERRQVWVAIAADQARQVLHLVGPLLRPVALACIEATEAWAGDPSGANRRAAIKARLTMRYADADAYAASSSAAASAASYAAAASASASASAASYASSAAAAYTAAASSADAYAAADAADAAAYTAAASSADAYAAADAADAHADDGGLSRLGLAHRAIDKFQELTGHEPVPVDSSITAEAVCKMREVITV